MTSFHVSHSMMHRSLIAIIPLSLLASFLIQVSCAANTDTCEKDKNGTERKHSYAMFGECKSRVEKLVFTFQPSPINPENICIGFLDEDFAADIHECIPSGDLKTFIQGGIAFFIFVVIMDVIGVLAILFYLLKCDEILHCACPPKCIKKKPPAAGTASKPAIAPTPSSAPPPPAAAATVEPAPAPPPVAAEEPAAPAAPAAS